jgi:iron complex outermembrane receptor protein
MFNFRFSAVSIAVLSALTLPVSLSVSAAEESSDSGEVIVVNGSQVKLGDEYEGGQVATTGRAGLLGNMDTMDTPFSSTNYTEELIRNQQALSVADVVQNDPTVRVATGFGNFQELYMIRGFNVYSDDMTLNGVYGILPRQFVAAEMLERVEVFRGANTFLNGAAPGGSAIGGLVNLVPKRAGDEPLTRMTVGMQSGGQGYAAMDFARRFGDLEQDGIRVNVIERSGNNATEEDRELGGLTLGWDHQGERARLSADFGYQDNHIDAARPSVTPSTSAPAVPDASTNYAQDWTYTDEKQLFGVVRGEYDFTSSTMGWVAVGARQGKEHNLLANPTADSAGNITTYAFENVREDDIFSADAGLRQEFATGDIHHTAVLSASYFDSASKNAYFWSTYFSAGTLSDYQQVAQNTTALYSGGDLNAPKVTERNTTSSIALADTMALLDDKVKLTLGGRSQTIEQKGYNYDGSAASEYDKSAVTPFAGVVYQPTYDWSLYANYAEALIKGEIVSSWGGYTNPGQVFSPTRSEQYETGVKYDNGMLGAVVSVFEISKPTYIVANNTYTRDGEQRNRGLELSGYGLLSDSVKVLGGVTFIDAELVKTTDGTNDGNSAIGVPDMTANLNLEWDTPFAEGLTLEGRSIYTSSQYLDAANQYDIPSWTRFDLGARYVTTVDEHNLTLRARLENVADKDYWASSGGYPGKNYLVQGAPRTLMLSASYDF